MSKYIITKKEADEQRCNAFVEDILTCLSSTDIYIGCAACGIAAVWHRYRNSPSESSGNEYNYSWLTIIYGADLLFMHISIFVYYYTYHICSDILDARVVKAIEDLSSNLTQLRLDLSSNLTQTRSDLSSNLTQLRLDLTSVLHPDLPHRWGSQLGSEDYYGFGLQARLVPTLAELQVANPDGWKYGSKDLRMKISKLLETYKTIIAKHKGNGSVVAFIQPLSLKLFTALKDFYYNESHTHSANIFIEQGRKYSGVKNEVSIINGESDHALVYSKQPDNPKYCSYALAVWEDKKLGKPLGAGQSAQVVYICAYNYSIGLSVLVSYVNYFLLYSLGVR